LGTTYATKKRIREKSLFDDLGVLKLAWEFVFGHSTP
jgi:hypothetical protein